MRSPLDHRDIHELLPGYSLDALSPEEEAAVARHLGLPCELCSEELTATRKVVAALILLEATPPPAGLKSRLMKRIAEISVQLRTQKSLEERLPGVFVLPEGSGDWKRTPYLGVTTKPLYFDHKTGCLTSLLRMEPDAEYPAHRHVRAEQCMVLEGSVRLGTVSLSKGDFEFALADTNHGTVKTDTGCTLLIIASVEDEILA